MPKTSYIAVCAVAALGFSLVSPKAASAFPPAPGAGITYTQTVAGNAAISVRWGGRVGGWGVRGVGFGRGFGWGGHGWGWRGGGWGWRGVGWRRGYYGGWRGYGWGWPVGLGLGLAAAATYPYYGGGYYSGYYPAYYGGCGW